MFASGASSQNASQCLLIHKLHVVLHEIYTVIQRSVSQEFFVLCGKREALEKTWHYKDLTNNNIRRVQEIYLPVMESECKYLLMQVLVTYLEGRTHKLFLPS